MMIAVETFVIDAGLPNMLIETREALDASPFNEAGCTEQAGLHHAIHAIRRSGKHGGRHQVKRRFSLAYSLVVTIQQDKGLTRG